MWALDMALRVLISAWLVSTTLEVLDYQQRYAVGKIRVNSHLHLSCPMKVRGAGPGGALVM